MPILFVTLSVLLLIATGVFWLLLAAFSWTTALAVYFVGTCVLLILVVLIQKPKGGGLAGAFGGAGGGQQAVFGAKAGDMFTLVTVCLFMLFLILGMGLVYSTRLDDAKLATVPDAGSQMKPPKQDKAPAGGAGSTAPDAPQTPPKNQNPDGTTDPADDAPAPPATDNAAKPDSQQPKETDKDSAKDGPDNTATPPKGSNP